MFEKADLLDQAPSEPRSSARPLILSKQLDRLLAHNEMSYRELSRESGVSLKTLYHWRSGQRPLADERLFRVATVLRVDLVELLFGRTSETGSDLKIETIKTGSET
ncbi:helix-turn-helix domain-containing protein [Bdellovibrio sp. HCB-162]|uniref:helix-turn-helix domain-containing protein n=1 Tax=Bdellovibrio sp. HCB-162 TaxID=3394234 RepID=UPI0039BD1FC6